MTIAMACRMYSNLWVAHSLNGGSLPVRIGTRDRQALVPGVGNRVRSSIRGCQCSMGGCQT